MSDQLPHDRQQRRRAVLDNLARGDGVGQHPLRGASWFNSQRAAAQLAVAERRR